MFGFLRVKVLKIPDYPFLPSVSYDVRLEGASLHTGSQHQGVTHNSVPCI